MSWNLANLFVRVMTRRDKWRGNALRMAPAATSRSCYSDLSIFCKFNKIMVSQGSPRDDATRGWPTEVAVEPFSPSAYQLPPMSG
jgi:hypothetical protein